MLAIGSEKEDYENKQIFKNSLKEFEFLYRERKEDYEIPDILECKRRVLVKDDLSNPKSEKVTIEKVKYLFNSIDDAFNPDNSKLSDEQLEKLSEGDIVTLYFSVCFFKWLIGGKYQSGFRNELSAIKLVSKAKALEFGMSPIKSGAKKRKIKFD